MAIQNQGWAYVSGTLAASGTPGGMDTNIQFNNNGDLSGSSLLITDGSGSISGSTTIQGASLSVDGAATAGTFHGDGSSLTNISSDDVDTTTDTTNATRYIPFVANATSTDGEILLIDDAISVNPSTGVFTAAGGIVAGGAISSATTIDGSGDLTMGTITMTGFSVDADGDTQVKTLDVNSGGITEAGAIAGASTINASGLISAGSLNLDGVTVTATAAEINYLDDDDLTAADLTKLAAVYATAAQLNFNYNVTAGTAKASKSVVLDVSKDVTGINNLTASFFKGDGSALTNLPGGGGGGGLLTAINGTQVYLTSSLAIGGSTAPDHTLSISGSVSGSGIVRAGSFAADGAAVLGGSLTAVGVVAGGAISSATTIDGSGDLTMGTITMSAFTVDGSGNTACYSLDVNEKVNITTAGAISGGTSYSGSLGVTGSAFKTDGEIVGRSLTDGVATISAGIISGGTSYSGSTTIQGASLSVDGDITCTDISMRGAQQISFGTKITGDQTLTTPFYRVYLVDTTTGQHDVILPAINTATHGLVLTVKDAGSNAQANVINITGSTFSGNKIDGSANAKTINGDNGWATLVAHSSSTGTHVWYQIAGK